MNELSWQKLLHFTREDLLINWKSSDESSRVCHFFREKLVHWVLGLGTTFLGTFCFLLQCCIFVSLIFSLIINPGQSMSFQAHAVCYRQMPKECDFGVLRKILLPPSSLTIPRTELPMEQLLAITANDPPQSRKGQTLALSFPFLLYRAEDTVTAVRSDSSATIQQKTAVSRHSLSRRVESIVVWSWDSVFFRIISLGCRWDLLQFFWG